MNDSQTVKEALKEFYDTHYFGDAAFRDDWVMVQVGPIKLPMYNSAQRKQVVHLHDLTHLVTGYDTSWAGEGEVAAHELAIGFPLKYWVGYIYSPFALIGGLMVAPKRTLRSWKKWRGKMNLYKLDLPRATLDQMTIGELKLKINSKSV